MKKIKICAVQFKVLDGFSKNISKVEKFFKKASKNKCDIICFPEVFLTAGSSKKEYNGQIPNTAKNHFSMLSRKYKIHSIMGSIIEKISKKFYNISYLFDDKGNIVGSYKKNHLTESESKYIKPDNEIKVFRTKIGNIGIQICRDLLYPEITRKLMLKKAQVIFCPSFWCSKSASYSHTYNYKYFKNRIPKEVDFLVSARAIESEVVFVYVNAAGILKKKGMHNMLGKTQIALPFYGTTGKLNHNREGILIREVNLNIIGDAKKIYKIEGDLKDYYKK